MPIPVLIWIVTAAFAGAALGYFWEDVIKPWAIKAAGRILDSINSILLNFSDGLLYLLKKGEKYIVELRVYLKDNRSGDRFVETERRKVSDDEFNQLPAYIRSQVEQKKEVQIEQVQTQTRR